MADNRYLSYFTIRTALHRFGQMPGALDAADAREVAAQAEREAQLVLQVLGSGHRLPAAAPKAEVDAAVRALADCFDDETTFETALLQQGLGLEDLRAVIADELRVGIVLDEVAGEEACAVSDAEVEEFYQRYCDRFVHPEKRSTHQILITINDDYAENTRTAAKARIEALAEELRSDPAGFEDAARRYSECPTAMEGGLLGAVPRGTLYPELETCLFDMEEGAVSEVLESPIGFHLLYCREVEPGRPMAFDEVKASIRKRLEQNCRRNRLAEWFAALPERRVSA